MLQLVPLLVLAVLQTAKKCFTKAFEKAEKYIQGNLFLYFPIYMYLH